MSFSGRMYSPSPSVASPRVPLYLQGVPFGLGQDDFSPSPTPTDFTPVDATAPDLGPYTVASPSFSFPATDPTLQPLMDQGFTADEADMINAAAANGVITDAQFQSILAGNHSYDSVANTIFGTVTPQGPPLSAASPQAQAQAAAIAAAAKGGSTASNITQAITAGAKATQTVLAPGSAPRVGVPVPGAAAGSFTSMLTQQSIPGIPNGVLLVGGAVLFLAIGAFAKPGR